jgi:diguanylate cyclase (GGDEF)-like protein
MAHDFRFGIGFKLALLLASFSIVAMGLVGYNSYASSRATLLGATQRDLLTATQVLGQNFEQSIAEVSADVLLLARVPASAGIAAPVPAAGAARERSALADLFAALLDVHPEYFQVRLISARDNGLELVRVDRDGARLSRIEGGDLQEKAHFPYVFHTLRMAPGQVHLSDITINHEAGAHSGLDKPTLRVATPVAGADGKVLGIVVINVDLNRLFARLQHDLPKAYLLYLSNHWGDYLIHPDPSQSFGFDQGRRILIQDGFPRVADLIAGKEDTLVTDQDSAGEVAAFVRLPLALSGEKHFVVLGLAQPLERVVRETKALGWSTARMILVLGSLAVVIAAMVSRAVTGPLREMVDAVTLFSRQHVVRELPTTRGDQLGLLARTLNDMQRTIVGNIRELDESRQALRHLAQHDPLTGLPNRALFDDRLHQAVTHARRAQVRVALLFVDLDGFKSINDSYGHQAGDLLLTAVAQRMHACVRSADTVGRLGGDEFVVLLTEVERPPDALVVAEKIRHALEQPFDIASLKVSISASIGVAIFPDHGADERALSWSADAAMYLAKESGGNGVRMFGSQPGQN